MCSPTKISRIETAQRSIGARDVRDLSDLYGLTDGVQRDQLMELAQQAKQRAWWQNYDEIEPTYKTLIGLETEAASIRQYETILVPGLLQTPEYSRAVIKQVRPWLNAAGIDRLVDVRQARQEVLTGTVAPSFWAILDEAALHRMVGGPEVVRQQVQELIKRSELPNVTLQVIMFDAGAHEAMEGAFWILEFAQREVQDVVYIEGLTGALYLDREEDLARYRRTFDYLRATAASPVVSSDHLAQLAARLNS
jgi:hypothetical protein